MPGTRVVPTHLRLRSVQAMPSGIGAVAAVLVMVSTTLASIRDVEC